jgi:hypothetical protein
MSKSTRVLLLTISIAERPISADWSSQKAPPGVAGNWFCQSCQITAALMQIFRLPRPYPSPPLAPVCRVRSLRAAAFLAGGDAANSRTKIEFASERIVSRPVHAGRFSFGGGVKVNSLLTRFTAMSAVGISRSEGFDAGRPTLS